MLLAVYRVVPCHGLVDLCTKRLDFELFFPHENYGTNLMYNSIVLFLVLMGPVLGV